MKCTDRCIYNLSSFKFEKKKNDALQQTKQQKQKIGHGFLTLSSHLSQFATTNYFNLYYRVHF